MPGLTVGGEFDLLSAGGLLVLVLVLVLVWPALRVCLHFSLWVWFPRTLIWVGLALLAGLGLTHGVACYLPDRLPSLLALFLCVRLWHGWRSRPEYGTREGLPPGPLATLDPSPWTQPDYYSALAEQHGSVFKVCHLFAPTLCIADLELAWEFLASEAGSLESPPLRFHSLVPGGSLRYMSPDAHQHYRSIFGAGLSGAALEACQPYLEAAVKAALLRLAAHSQNDPRAVLDLLAQEVMLGVIHGVRPQEARYQQLNLLYHQLDVAAVERDFLPWKPHRRRFQQALQAVIEEIRVYPEGPIPRHIEASHPGALKDPVVRANLALMVDVGSRDVAGLMTWILWMLANHCGWEQAVCPLSVVMETLRLEQSEYLFRRTTREIQWRGFKIPRGWLVRVCVHEAHRRASQVDATAFNPKRQPAESGCRPFGARPHACLGQSLTRRLGALFVEQLASHFELRLLGDGPRQFDGWHWRPSSRFRIQLIRVM